MLVFGTENAVLPRIIINMGIFCYLFYLINFQKCSNKMEPDENYHFGELNSQEV